jgi:predicted metal-dependent hydrolase
MTLAHELMKLPRPLVEYVVCHELLHLRIPQHGAGFNVLLNSYIPDWKWRQLALAAYSIASV